MKHPLIAILLFANLYAKGELTVVGGINLGNIRYNDKTLANRFEGT